MIPYWVIAAGAFWSALAFLLAGLAFRHRTLFWLMIPFALLGGVYTWFSLIDVPVELRAVWVRGTLALILYTLAPILTAISLMILFLQKGKRHDD